MIDRIRLSEKTFSQRSEPRGETRLKTGQSFWGRVLRQDGEGDVLVSFRGRSISARSESRVRAGEDYLFQVKSSGEKVILGVRQEGGAVGAGMVARRGVGHRLGSLLRELASLDLPRNLGPETKLMFNRLSQLLPAVIYARPQKDPSLWLARHFALSGLFWESKVARYLLGGVRGPWKSVLGEDLKGLLLEIQSSLGSEGQDEKGVLALAQKVEDTLLLIEEHQLANLSLSEEEGGWFLFVPGQPDEGWVEADLYCRKTRGRQRIQFSIDLEFVSLGPTAVVASMEESAMEIQFWVVDEEKAQLVRESFPLLESGLNEAGFVIRSLQCGVQGGMPDKGECAPDEEGHDHSLHVVI